MGIFLTHHSGPDTGNALWKKSVLFIGLSCEFYLKCLTWKPTGSSPPPSWLMPTLERCCLNLGLALLSQAPGLSLPSGSCLTAFFKFRTGIITASCKMLVYLFTHFSPNLQPGSFQGIWQSSPPVVWLAGRSGQGGTAGK